MVEHVVLIKAKPEATEAQRDLLIAELGALKEKIPGIVSLSVGRNFSERNQGFHIGLVVRFVDRASLDAYGPHPAHQEVVQQFLAPVKQDVIVVDYEIE